MKVLWRDETLAESDKTVLIEGNHYFPPESVNHTLLKKSKYRSLCYWKGLASYYNIEYKGSVDKNSAWYYHNPTWFSRKVVGKDFTDYVAFWGNVKVIN